MSMKSRLVEVRATGLSPMIALAPEAQVESEVLSGLHGVLDLCADPQKFTRAVNNELRQIWEASIDFKPDSGERIAAIDGKVSNIRRAVEEGLNDSIWANTRLRELHTERESLVAASRRVGGPPQLDAATAMDYRRQAEKLLKEGGQAERKQLLRTLVAEVKLVPQDLEVSISYRVPEAIMNGLVAGERNAPNPFKLPFRIELVQPVDREIA